MFILYGILVALAIGAVDVLVFANDKKPSTITYHLVCDTVLANILALFSATNIFGKKNIFLGFVPYTGFILKYLAMVVVFGIILVIVKAILGRKLYFEAEKPKKNPKGAMALKVISTILVMLGTAAITATIWGKKTFGETSLDQMLITLMSPTTGTSYEVYNTAIEGPVLQTSLITAIYSAFMFSNYKLIFNKNGNIKTLLTEYAKRIVAFILALIVFIGGLWYGIARFHLTDYIKANYVKSTYIEDNYANPSTTQLVFPEKKRNLIHIYLESVENTYFSKDLGGNMDVNLMPALAELSKEGYSFSHTSNTFGGPTPNTGGTWSCASMVNQAAGVPMKFTNQAHYCAIDNFLPNVVTLGDILEEQGYEQSAMFGADASFGGLDFFFESHGHYNMIDYKAAIEKGMIPEDYRVWWGFEDDKLYEFAKDEITRLYETGKPFNFIMENADTHFPDGYLSPNATEQVHESQYGNVIYYSQSEVVKFVKWIQEQPFYENTTVVLIGDHLTMDANFIDTYVDDNYERTTYNLILNPDPSVANVNSDRLYNRRWANFDLFPTILSSIGVQIDGNHLGMGTNLFSNEQTLFERDGVKYVNGEVEKLSLFYNEHILGEEVKSKKD